MLTNFFITLGWTRDDWKWFWLQIVTVAALITSNVFDIQYWATYLGVTLTPTILRWIQALSALVLWISARNQASTLPGIKGGSK